MNDMAGLKLGKLPDRKTVKFTFTASVQLSNLLEEYAILYEKAYGRRETAAGLIPFMLEAFINSDIGFRKARKENALPLKINLPAADNKL